MSNNNLPALTQSFMQSFETGLPKVPSNPGLLSAWVWRRKSENVKVAKENELAVFQANNGMVQCVADAMKRSTLLPAEIQDGSDEFAHRQRMRLIMEESHKKGLILLDERITAQIIENRKNKEVAKEAKISRKLAKLDYDLRLREAKGFLNDSQY